MAIEPVLKEGMQEQTISSMKAFLESVRDELNDLQAMDQMEMYRHLTQLGNNLINFGAPNHVPENFVQGCTSNVYIEAKLVNGRVQYSGSSEALVVRGYVAILVEALSGLSASDIVNFTETSIKEFSEQTNIRATLTPSRANAFGNVYGLMKSKAQSFTQ